MAAEAPDTPELLARFGPTRAYPSGQGLDTSSDPERLVKTHCCFCGQQCGIQLKVKRNQVIGFEPWLDFPFNKGMLCPKGVRRYLQSSHPDRLTSAYVKDASNPEGFRAVAYDEAIRQTAEAIQRIQSLYGNDAFGLLGGASMTTEKCYLIGKFARVCLKTKHIDYNGRLCMVSAAAGNKKAFGIDRAGNPMSDIPLAEVTKQYLSYVEQLRKHNLELASEYLLMAAMLIEIKSRMLLPPKKTDDGAEPEDPRAELVRRLLEYEQMKQAALRLDQMPVLGRDFLRAQIHIEQSLAPRLPDVNVDDLRAAWAELMRRAKLSQHHKISREQLSVREYMSHLLRKLQGQRFVEFEDLFELDKGSQVLVVSFIAMLELARERLVEITQAEAFAPIYVRLAYAPS